MCRTRHREVDLQTEFKSFIAAHLGSNTNQQTAWTLGGTCIKSSRSVYAPHLVQSVRLLLFKYRGGDNAHWISKNKMAATAVQWELCSTNFRENIANLWVSCYNGNNDRSPRVLFVQHHREQGEWLRQNPRYARVLRSGFDCVHSPCSLGCWTNNTLAARSLSPKILYRPCHCPGDEFPIHHSRIMILDV